MNNTALIHRDTPTKIETLEDLQTLGQVFVKSKFFSDATDAAQAIVKVMAGAELGFPPIASMTGVYIVKGKVSLSANLIAAAIKKSGKYNFRVRRLTAETCEIEFFENQVNIGESIFTMAEAKAAELTNNPTWKKFPRNMLYARAMSNGAKWYCPDIFGGPIYTPDELGATVDGETGEVIEMPAEPAQAIEEAPALGESITDDQLHTLNGMIDTLLENLTAPEVSNRLAFIADGITDTRLLSNEQAAKAIQMFSRMIDAQTIKKEANGKAAAV